MLMCSGACVYVCACMSLNSPDKSFALYEYFHHYYHHHRHSSSATDEGYNVQNSEVCRTCKNVVLQIINVLRPPCFDLVHRLRPTREKYLIGMMQEAANSDPSFR